VNWQAICGGSHPEAHQRRRRSIDAGDLGLDPVRLVDVAIGTTFRASISSAKAWASPSPTAPAPNARHTALASSASRVLGAAAMVRRISSTNIPQPSSGRVSAKASRSRNPWFRV
jgi:hypothetical protein